MKLHLWFVYGDSEREEFVMEVFRKLRRYKEGRYQPGFTVAHVTYISHSEALKEIGYIKALANRFGQSVVKSVKYIIYEETYSLASAVFEGKYVDKGEFKTS